MSKTIQIRDVEDDVYAALAVRAAEAGLSVPELLRREATRLASRPTVGEWLERLGRRSSDITSDEVLATLDEIRGLGRMLVVDAGCLFEALVGSPVGQSIKRHLRDDEEQAAPHVVDVETLNVIRRYHLDGRLDETAARQAAEDLQVWPGERFGHQALVPRAWDLRNNVRGWDAFYVALAEALDATLLTLDRRLARATGPRCRIELPSP